MDVLLSGNVKNCRGYISERHVPAEGEDHYCYEWMIINYTKYVDQKELPSPEFTVPHRDGCKWYLSLASIPGGTDEAFIFCMARLVLDRKSDCKAVAKFKLYRSTDQEIASWKTFKFDTQSDNSTGFLFTIDKNFYHSNGNVGEKNLTVVCKIIIESVYRQDDTFSTDLGSLLKTQQLTDFVISAGTKNYPVHKAILAAHSSVFTAMFSHNMIENQGVLSIKDIDEEVVEQMISYIYTGQVEKLKDLAQDLLIAADKYDLKGLIIKCEEILIESLSSSNVFDLLLFAKTCNSSELKAEAINFIIRSTHLMKTPAWESISESSPELLREICEVHFQSKFQSKKSRLIVNK